ncbi:hypothetical protein NPIL_684881, partial [Nephila pilipes]
PSTLIADKATTNQTLYRSSQVESDDAFCPTFERFR